MGEYVSAMSNAATFHHKKNAFFIWGVNNESYEGVGTKFNQYIEIKNEPYQNYLVRNLSPSINFTFEELTINKKRVVQVTTFSPVEKEINHKNSFIPSNGG